MSTAHTGSTQEATTASATMDGPDHPVTAALAEFVTKFDLSAVDPAVVAAAKVLILDGLGCLVAGANHPVAGILLRYADEIGGRGSCTLLSRGDRTNAPLAAFVHGAMLHVNDYEPQGAIPMHGTSNLLPSALAVAEQNGRDGSELARGRVGSERGAGVAITCGRKTGRDRVGVVVGRPCVTGLKRGRIRHWRDHGELHGAGGGSPRFARASGMGC